MEANKLRTAINIGLIVTFIGLLITFPFKETLTGGLLFAIFVAALIGGLADSFAIKAIFGQPLKIKWPSWIGTNIVARHRERLMKELVHMVQHELLSIESIQMALDNKKLTHILQNYLASETGQRTLNEMLTHALKEVVKGNNITFLLLSLKRLLTQLIETTYPSQQLVLLITYIYKENIDQTLSSIIVKSIQPILRDVKIRSIIKQFVVSAIQKYEKDNRRRQVANQIANIDADQLTIKLFEYVEQWVFDLTDEEHPLRKMIKEKAFQLIEKIEQDEYVAHEFDTKIKRMFPALFNTVIKSEGYKHFINKIEKAITEYDEDHFIVQGSKQIILKIDSYIKQGKLERYDHLLLKWLLAFIEGKQDTIGHLVYEKLNSFSTDELILLVEQKAGKDLQFIRLNGTVVGGLIGGLLFAIQTVLGGGM